MNVKMTKKDKIDAIEDILWQLEDYVFNMTCSLKDKLITYEKYDEEIKRDMQTAVWVIKNIVLEK